MRRFFPRKGTSGISEAIARNRRRPGLRQILYDITLLAESDAHTGIERVVRSILAQLIRKAPAGYRVEPVRIEAIGFALPVLPSPRRWASLLMYFPTALWMRIWATYMLVRNGRLIVFRK